MEETEDNIAVVGIGCNFPGGEGLDNFWKVLLQGKNCAVPIPRERFDVTRWYDPCDTKAGKTRTAKAALIDGFNDFDHKFFGISGSEVEQMDPQQKQLLQCVYRALENAGIPMEKASGTRTGVFFGIMNRDYETNAAHVHPSMINHWTGTGLAMSIAANRVSYIFNFTGPSLSVDCACSSSLVALHLACQSIKQGDSDMAFCGGVSCIIEPRVFVALSKAKMIAPDGTSKPFSRRADGYGRGEGCGVVLLKPLKKALKDHDHIWGVIRKTAVNQDGHSVMPITKPSMTQQEELLRRIYSASDLANAQYIEAHGTGTRAGDPTEALSISNVIAKERPPGSLPLLVGSVKSNIGHTESAAGVAGLIKVLLMIKHETIVPSVFYTDDTSIVDAKSLNIKIPQKTEKWSTTRARTAGVNSFGFGGTNAHAIVAQHVQQCDEQRSNERQVKYFVTSANSLKSLSMTIQDTIKQLETDKEVNLHSLCYTSACRRSHQKHKFRRVIAASSVTDLKQKLGASVGKNVTPASLGSKLVFVFCGNGVTYHGMCKQLLKKEPVFREKIAEISELFQSLGSINVLNTLESEIERNDLNKADVAQPSLFAIQVGIATLLKHWGVKPDAILGHSVGEVAAAHCSGLLSLNDAVKVIYFRSSMQTKVKGGKMLVVSNMPVSDISSCLSPYSGNICLAAFNSPLSCTLSGEAHAIESLQKKLSNSATSQNLFLHMLDVSTAYHSHMMDPILSDIRKAIGSLHTNDLDTELFSTVTGKEVQRGDFCTGKYWARNIREPVAFEQAVRSVAKDKRSLVFVEIGPRRVLQRNIMETLGNGTTVLASVLPEKDHESVVSVVSQLFELGAPVDWNTFYKGYETVPLSFPRYQFDCSNRDIIIGAAQKNTQRCHPVLFQAGNESNIFSCDLTSDSTFYLKEHKYNGIPIIPGAFYAELGLAAFMARAKPKVPLSSVQLSVSFHNPFVLNQKAPEIKVQFEEKGQETSFTVLSPSAVYASGTAVLNTERLLEESVISLSSIFKRCTSVVNFMEFYSYLSQGGFQYGDVFQNKEEIHYGEELKEAYALISVPEVLMPHFYDYHIHPVVLDYLMQLLPVTVEHLFAGRPGFPAKIGSLRVFQPLQRKMVVYLRAIDVGTDHFEICGCFTDIEGRVLAEVKHVFIKYLGSHCHVVEEYFYHNAFDVTPGFSPTSPPKALIFSNHVGISKGLQQHLHSSSRFVSLTHTKDILRRGFPSILEKLQVTNIEKNFDEVLFLCGEEDLTSLAADVILQNLGSCCEAFRQIVLGLKQISFPNSIRAVTHCSSDITVDHINPGFALAGMTRSLAAEIPELSFQLIDVSTVSAKDIEALSEVLRSYPCSNYPELVVKDGQILKPTIVRTPPETSDTSAGSYISAVSKPCIFQTNDAYIVTELSAIHFELDAEEMTDTSVEIQPRKFCIHTSDYFPVSALHLKFGQTLYWNKHSRQKHKLLALDFSGTVTAIGKHVRKLKIGDPVAVCCPVVAATKVRVPEDVCYNIKRFPYLEKTPCVSYFIIAWEIVVRGLPRAKHNLGILCSVTNSALVNILVCACTKSGWNVGVGEQCNASLVNANQMDAFVILPPFDKSLASKILTYSRVQHVVIVCEYSMESVQTQEVIKNFKESVHTQTILVSDIFQKGYLRANRPHIHHWLKSLNFGRKFILENFTFHCEKSESSSLDSGKVKSYFNTKTLAIVPLEKAFDSELSAIPLLPTKKQLFQRRAVYIVAGGLSGLGFETVKFISQRGGGNIVILSRSKPKSDMRKEILSVEKQCGNNITSIECDVSVYEQVDKVVCALNHKFPDCPIRGVFHSAVVLHDGMIETLDRSLFEKVFRPKVNGVLNLHLATQRCKLDYFVCFSSISAFLGNASQTNYAAANSFLDLFCHFRRKLGLPGQSINWGALNLGLLLNKKHFHRFLEAKGMMVLDVAEVHKSIEQCLVLNRPQQAVCKFHFRNIRYNVLSQNRALTLRLSALVEEAFRKFNDMESKYKQKDAISPRHCAISLLSETIGRDQSGLGDDTYLFSLGIDSMQAMTLQNLIFQERGVNVPLVNLLDPKATLSTVINMLSEAPQGEHVGEEHPPADNRNYFSTRL